MEEIARTISASLQKSGWHLNPVAVPGILHHLMDDLGTHSQPFEALVLAQLLDADLKDVGAPCLPDASTLQRIPRLQGPLVLQVVSVRNICESGSKSLAISHQQQGRLLRICLTDGHTKVIMIEYQPLPAFSLNTAPGTKVRLGDTILVQSGILLGNARLITILGGHVQALYEAWEIERKYSGLARATLKASRVEGSSGPPPFHGLPVAAQGRLDAEKPVQVARQSDQHSTSNSSGSGVTRETPSSSTMQRSERMNKANSESEVCVTLQGKTAKDSDKAPPLRIKPGFEPYRPRSVKTTVPEIQSLEMEKDWSVDKLPESLLSPEATQAEEASSSYLTLSEGEVPELTPTSEISTFSMAASSDKDTNLNGLNVRVGVQPKVTGIDARVDAIRAAMALGLEPAPLQNRAAAQKLLEKRTDSYSKGGGGRGRGRDRKGGRHGRGGRGEETATLTLDEWESRKGTANMFESEADGISGDEALAWKLQQQLDLESSSVSSTTGKNFDEAEQIRLSMFNFAVDRSSDESGGERRRGRGRRHGH